MRSPSAGRHRPLPCFGATLCPWLPDCHDGFTDHELRLPTAILVHRLFGGHRLAAVVVDLDAAAGVVCRHPGCSTSHDHAAALVAAIAQTHRFDHLAAAGAGNVVLAPDDLPLVDDAGRLIDRAVASPAATGKAGGQEAAERAVGRPERTGRREASCKPAGAAQQRTQKATARVRRSAVKALDRFWPSWPSPLPNVPRFCVAPAALALSPRMAFAASIARRA